jgi:hypothetical protein
MEQRSEAGFLLRRPWFKPTRLSVRFMALKQVYLVSCYFWVSPANHHSAIVTYSSLTVLWGVQQPWPGSTVSQSSSLSLGLRLSWHLAGYRVRTLLLMNYFNYAVLTAITLLLYHEDGEHIVVRNVDKHLPDYMTSCFKRHTDLITLELSGLTQRWRTRLVFERSSVRIPAQTSDIPTESIRGFSPSEFGNIASIRTRYLPACSIVPQPTTLPRASCVYFLDESRDMLWT